MKVIILIKNQKKIKNQKNLPKNQRNILLQLLMMMIVIMKVVIIIIITIQIVVPHPHVQMQRLVMIQMILMTLKPHLKHLHQKIHYLLLILVQMMMAQVFLLSHIKHVLLHQRKHQTNLLHLILLQLLPHFLKVNFYLLIKIIFVTS
eukprot:UN03737